MTVALTGKRGDKRAAKNRAIETRRRDPGELLAALGMPRDLRRTEFRCPMPNHDDRHPSAGIYTDSTDVWRFKCHGACQLCEDVFGIEAHLRGGSRDDAIHRWWGRQHPPLRLMKNGEAPRTRLTPQNPKQLEFAELAARLAAQTIAEQFEEVVRLYPGTIVPGWRALGSFVTEDAELIGRANWRDGSPPRRVLGTPETDDAGTVTNIQIRELVENRRKSGPAGGGRGLVVVVRSADGPIIVTEGASDAASAAGLGFDAIAMPSAGTGRALLDGLLEQHPEYRERLVVVGDDDKSGRAAAQKLAEHLGVPWVVPVGANDLRDLVAAGADADAVRKLLDGAEHVEVPAAEKTTEAPKPTTATRLLELVRGRFDVFVDTNEEGFAIEGDRPGIARQFRGSDSFRSVISRMYEAEHGAPPNANACADALRVLEAEATDVVCDVSVRIAGIEGGFVYDLADHATDRFVIVRPDGWTIEDTVPNSVVFRRSKTTSPAATPERDGDLEELFALLNLSPDQFDLIVAWLVSALVLHGEDIERPILLLHGAEGAAKSWAARFVMALVDPQGKATLRAQPRDEQTLAIHAAGSCALCYDNVSHVPDWLSDAFCRLISGGAYIGRRLYTNSDDHVHVFRRVLVLTTIGFVPRGDFADRCLGVELPVIADEQRCRAAELRADFETARGRIFGALLSLAAEVLRVLPDVQLEATPRLADFCRVVAAVDAIRGTTALDGYLEGRERLAENVAEGDPVGMKLLELSAGDGWRGYVGEFYRMGLDANERRRHEEWPRSSSAMGFAIRRMQGALRSMGVVVTMPECRGRGGRRLIVAPSGGRGEG